MTLFRQLSLGSKAALAAATVFLSMILSRSFLAETLELRPALAVAVTAVLSTIGLLNAAQPPVVKTVEVPIHQLPASMDNLKIVLLSDIHLGPTVGRTKMEMFVRMVNRLEPDITVIVGDLSDSEASVLRTAVAPLGQLHSRLGTYFLDLPQGCFAERMLKACTYSEHTV